ncbi:MAG: hypothetical protein HOM58_00310 [Rhodospirillaceae bacterium]|jgi:hypothetical protein|nr:hypothetical protein [Rhodospirillaceae bacterium]MBT5046916.1 hypothetical protein [Rhodospirillaceae bacterium]MBT5457029.1 hypothetical protein [Rhodospirillaceae bacterium]
MIRVLLITIVPFFLPAAMFVLWRTFVPPSLGGSEAIERDVWEPLPWKWLLIIGAVLTSITLVVAVMYPDFLGGM